MPHPMVHATALCVALAASLSGQLAATQPAARALLESALHRSAAAQAYEVREKQISVRLLRSDGGRVITKAVFYQSLDLGQRYRSRLLGRIVGWSEDGPTGKRGQVKTLRYDIASVGPMGSSVWAGGVLCFGNAISRAPGVFSTSPRGILVTTRWLPADGLPAGARVKYWGSARPGAGSRIIIRVSWTERFRAGPNSSRVRWVSWYMLSARSLLIQTIRVTSHSTNAWSAEVDRLFAYGSPRIITLARPCRAPHRGEAVWHESRPYRRFLRQNRDLGRRGMGDR